MLRVPKRFLLRLLKDAGFALAGVLITLTAWVIPLPSIISRGAHRKRTLFMLSSCFMWPSC